MESFNGVLINVFANNEGTLGHAGRSSATAAIARPSTLQLVKVLAGRLPRRLGREHVIQYGRNFKYLSAIAQPNSNSKGQQHARILPTSSYNHMLYAESLWKVANKHLDGRLREPRAPRTSFSDMYFQLNYK